MLKASSAQAALQFAPEKILFIEEYTLPDKRKKRKKGKEVDRWPS
jgi:hypothetical protein